MPNWCSNVLTVKGSPEDIAKFLAALRVDQEGIYDCQLPGYTTPSVFTLERHRFSPIPSQWFSPI